MNDDERVEAELLRLQPVPLDEGLMRNLSETMAGRLSLADRLLAASAGVGAVAAAVIVAIAVRQMTAREPPAPAVQTAHQSVASEVDRMLASR